MALKSALQFPLPVFTLVLLFIVFGFQLFTSMASSTTVLSSNPLMNLATSSMKKAVDIHQQTATSLNKMNRDSSSGLSDSGNDDEPSAIILKRKKGQMKDYNKVKVKRKLDATAEEKECTQTMYMSPYHHNIHFSLNSSIYSRLEKICKWKFIGSEPCIPKITCDTSNLTRDCTEEYLEIVDGAQGSMRICKGSGDKQQVVNISAADGLRDIYVHFKVFKAGKIKKISTLFNCTVMCSKNLKGSPLEKRFVTKLNPKCLCGTKPNEDKIVGGETAKKFEYPWLVALVETNTRQPFSGGSIVNNRFILSAAHCFQGRFMDSAQVQVVVNGHEFDQSPNVIRPGEPPPVPKTYSPRQLEKIDRMNSSKRYNIEEIMIHHLYVIETNDFDVAMLKLQEDIDLSPKPLSLMTSETMDIYLQQPRAICLPELGSYARTFSNKKATVAGWGLPSMNARGTMTTLQQLEVKVFSPQVCKDLYAHRVNKRMMCAGHREGGKDSCSGDSGGPLVIEERRNVWTQVGAVSWGDGCGEKNHPGVYLRLTEVVQWIHYNSNYNGGRDYEDEEDMSATWCMTPQE